MHRTSYVTYAQVEAHAVEHFKRFKTPTGFMNIINYLFDHGYSKEGSPMLPNSFSWENLSDSEFADVLKNLPVINLLLSNEHARGQIPAESIMPEELEVFSICYIRNIVEQMHTHNFFEVNYVFEGSCKMVFENETRVLSSGQLCIIAPQSLHDVTVTDDSIILSLMLRESTFETTFFKLLAQKDILASFFRDILYSCKKTANYMLFFTDNNIEIKNSIKNIFMECYVSDAYSNTCVISRVHLLFSLLLRNFSDTIQLYEDQKSIDERSSFTQILCYLQNHYLTLSLDSLAEKFHYNPSYMSLLIKKNTGQTLTQILTKLKLSKASALLLHTDWKIEEISKASGYDNIDHFSRTFKKAFGCSPSAFRKHE